MNNPLLDYAFLRKLDLYPHKTVYAKIILLNFNEQPVQEIQGQITGGSVNVDGASAVRRTCSLTMLTNEEKIDNIYWGLKNKFKLEIGLENQIDARYPDIIWFKQGLYVITSLSESLNASNHTINISGKDKGCLINGEFGGAIPSTTNFGKMDINETDDNDQIITTTIDVPIKEIIKNIMVWFGGEEPHNIVVNDIDNYGMELMAYKGDSPLYMIALEDWVTNITFDGSKQRECSWYDEDAKKWKTKTMSFEDDDFVFNTYVDQLSNADATRVISTQNKDQYYTVIKILKDEAVGYRKTELTYPGDLIANPGEAVTSVLDKIKNMFSTFEYFYDIDGKFHFQKKKTYTHHTWNGETITEDEIYVDAKALTSQTIYSFEDNQLLIALSKQPTLTNLRNDFSIQGVRKSVSGADIKIHMRYAISDKPIEYTTYDGIRYIADSEEIKITNSYIKCDWRELLYQMAKDYLRYNQSEDDMWKIAQNNQEYYPTGKTGYEMFYVDILGYWRTLYDPAQGGWVNTVKDNPAVLDFWIDFMDTSSEMGQYSIQTIGHRPKSVNDSNTVAIYYKQVPKVLLLTDGETELISKEKLQDYYNLSGYSFVQIPDSYKKYFTIGVRGKSAQDSLDDLLYQHLYCSEAITLTSVPIYYLQPNHRIFVRDSHTNTNGEYLLNKITVPLTYNGTSSLNAQLAPQRIY